ncbi:hypothetical protein [Streptomyces sp. NPDC056527]|uniref:hypothetical protein n=1 Tax=Streptomyces sp. NPDC056527 TaxID=3345853 RepID=UPI0036C35C7A
MGTHRMKRRLAAIATTIGTSVVMVVSVSATSAYADSVIEVRKLHSGSFVRGGTGTYHFQVTNSGPDATSSTVTLTDTVPTGLTILGTAGHPSWTCQSSNQTLTCTNETAVDIGQSFPPLQLNVQVADDAPCSITNTATVSGGPNDSGSSSSDTTPVTGGSCDADNSLLSVNLGGIIPLLNNITNGTIGSPSATNASK